MDNSLRLYRPSPATLKTPKSQPRCTQILHHSPWQQASRYRTTQPQLLPPQLLSPNHRLSSHYNGHCSPAVVETYPRIGQVLWILQYHINRQPPRPLTFWGHVLFHPVWLRSDQWRVGLRTHLLFGCSIGRTCGLLLNLEVMSLVIFMNWGIVLPRFRELIRAFLSHDTALRPTQVRSSFWLELVRCMKLKLNLPWLTRAQHVDSPRMDIWPIPLKKYLHSNVLTLVIVGEYHTYDSDTTVWY
jgi:hypothetical protein